MLVYFTVRQNSPERGVDFEEVDCSDLAYSRVDLIWSSLYNYFEVWAYFLFPTRLISFSRDII